MQFSFVLNGSAPPLPPARISHACLFCSEVASSAARRKRNIYTKKTFFVSEEKQKKKNTQEKKKYFFLLERSKRYLLHLASAPFFPFLTRPLLSLSPSDMAKKGAQRVLEENKKRIRVLTAFVAVSIVSLFLRQADALFDQSQRRRPFFSPFLSLTPIPPPDFASTFPNRPPSSTHASSARPPPRPSGATSSDSRPPAPSPRSPCSL